MNKRPCFICGEPCQDGRILCPEHVDAAQKGFVALIEALPNPEGRTAVRASQTERTGRVMMIHREALRQLVPPQVNINVTSLFIDPEAFEKLKTTIETLQARASLMETNKPSNDS